VGKQIPVVCEACDAMWYVRRWEEYARCPKCGFVTDIFNDGFDDRKLEEE
jgi:predicted RNA-binding Zn-ribbon protein involved in translation (DUF1610 family)